MVFWNVYLGQMQLVRKEVLMAHAFLYLSSQLWLNRKDSVAVYTFHEGTESWVLVAKIGGAKVKPEGSESYCIIHKPTTD